MYVFMWSDAHNSAAPDAFVKVMEGEKNHTGLWNAKLKCYLLDLPPCLGAQPQDQQF